MNEATNVGNLRRFQQHMCAHNVVLCELKGISKRIVHVSLSREVHDGVDLLRLQHVAHQFTAANISLDKSIIWISLDLIEILNARTICERNDIDASGRNRDEYHSQSSLSKFTILN